MPCLNCSYCGKEIQDNEHHIALNLGEEVLGDGSITVVWEDEIKTLCMECAELHDFKGVTVPLKHAAWHQASFRNQHVN